MAVPQIAESLRPPIQDKTLLNPDHIAPVIQFPVQTPQLPDFEIVPGSERVVTDYITTRGPDELNSRELVLAGVFGISILGMADGPVQTDVFVPLKQRNNVVGHTEVRWSNIRQQNEAVFRYTR